jgi:hypothetical protein
VRCCDEPEVGVTAWLYGTREREIASFSAVREKMLPDDHILLTMHINQKWS